MIFADARRVRADDFRESPFLVAEPAGFTEELGRMTHRADRVPDLMRDARGEASERGEFQLLEPPGDFRRVFEEHDDGWRVFVSERREVRQDLVRTVAGHESGARVLRPLAALPPGREQIQEPRGSLAEEGSRVGAPVSEDLRGGFVDQADAVLVVDHEEALAQVLHDVLRQLREIREIDFPALDQRLGFLQPRRERPTGERHQKEHEAENARGRIVGG